MTSDDCRFSCTEASLTPAGASRRVFLLGAAGASLAAGSLTARRAPAAENGESVALIAYIGCTNSAERRARAPQAAVGRGISVYRIDTNGSWSPAQTLETPPNPQFIAFDRQQKFLYAVHGGGCEVSSYAIDKASGRINFLNKQPTNGYNSTHLTPDPTNRYIVIGNGIVPRSVELCEASAAVNEVKRPSRFEQQRDCLFPFRSEQRARLVRPEVA
jgi:6-phosphogluconolactonase